jgi:hypothetical protein
LKSATNHRNAESCWKKLKHLGKHSRTKSGETSATGRSYANTNIITAITSP